MSLVVITKDYWMSCHGLRLKSSTGHFDSFDTINSEQSASFINDNKTHFTAIIQASLFLFSCHPQLRTGGFCWSTSCILFNIN